MLDHQVERILARSLGKLGANRDIAANNDWMPAPMLPMTLRERAVSPRTTPRWSSIQRGSERS
jgi:hypothetical protein